MLCYELINSVCQCLTPVRGGRRALARSTDASASWSRRWTHRGSFPYFYTWWLGKRKTQDLSGTWFRQHMSQWKQMSSLTWHTLKPLPDDGVHTPDLGCALQDAEGLGEGLCLVCRCQGCPVTTATNGRAGVKQGERSTEREEGQTWIRVQVTLLCMHTMWTACASSQISEPAHPLRTVRKHTRVDTCTKHILEVVWAGVVCTDCEWNRQKQKSTKHTVLTQQHRDHDNGKEH